VQAETDKNYFGSKASVHWKLNMQEYVPIRALQVGQIYSQVFLISSVANKTSKKSEGKKFVLLTVKDVTGTLRGCVWDLQIDESEKDFIPGKFISMTIAVESYNNERTFVAKNIAAFKEPVENLTDYVPGPNDHVLNVLKEDIEKTISDIDDPHYRDIINNSCQQIRLMDLMSSSSYGVAGPLAHRGGLLTHTALTLKAALGMVETGREPSVDIRIDRSLVIAACLLRNLGYFSGLQNNGTSFIAQDSAHLLGIRHLSTMLANHIVNSTETDLKIAIPEPKALALQNACLADSLDQCMTIEARIVFLANQFTDEIYNGRSLYDKHR
jgi:hypothetical protein